MDSELKSPYKISLDFYIRKIITVNAKQLDTNSRVINITCTENGKKMVLNSSTISAFVRYKKSDGYAVLNEISILDDGTLNLELSQQMLAVEGRQVVDIMLISGTELTTETVENILNSETMDGISVLSTMSFYINTEGCAIDGSKIESSYEYNAMLDGLGKMVAVDQRINTLENTINTNEVQRQSNERTRIDAEVQRISDETERKNAESARQVADAKRKIDVENYTKEMNNIIETSVSAVNEVNQAKDACQEVIDKVESIEDFDKIDEILNYKIEVTQAEYNALSEEEKNNGKIYFITDINEGGTASEVYYDNTKSGLVSANVQNVIDEVNEKKLEKNSVVNNLTTTEEGYALDARQGKILEDRISQFNDRLSHIGMIIHSTTLDTMEKVITIYGGIKWEKIEGRFLLGANNLYPIGNTGGEATHTLTIAEIPVHAHGFLDYWGTSYTDIGQGARNCVAFNGDGSEQGGGYPNSRTQTADTGGGQAHNNMPPYKAVYIWERVE